MRFESRAVPYMSPLRTSRDTTGSSMTASSLAVSPAVDVVVADSRVTPCWAVAGRVTGSNAQGRASLPAVRCHRSALTRGCRGSRGRSSPPSCRVAGRRPQCCLNRLERVTCIDGHGQRRRGHQCREHGSCGSDPLPQTYPPDMPVGAGSVSHEDLVPKGECAPYPLTPEPRLDAVKCFWNATNSATAGAASTTAPARIAPYGFVARPAMLLM